MSDLCIDHRPTHVTAKKIANDTLKIITNIGEIWLASCNIEKLKVVAETDHKFN